MANCTQKLHLWELIHLGLQQFWTLKRWISFKDPKFTEVSTVFKAEIAELKGEGKAQTQHKPPINKDNMKKLYQVKLSLKTNLMVE